MSLFFEILEYLRGILRTLPPTIYFSAVSGLFSMLATIGVGGWLINIYNRRRKNAYGRIIVSRNEIGELVEGTRELRLRNIGEELTLDKVILDPILRKFMTAAGKQCSTTRPFVMLPTAELQEEMLHAVRNHLTKNFVAGEMAASLQLPYKEKRVLFAVTCSDGPKGDVRKFRIIWIGEDKLDLCIDPAITKFEDGQDNHIVRARTLTRMHEVHSNGGSLPYRDTDKSMRRIIGYLQAKAPAPISEKFLAKLVAQTLAQMNQK